MEFVHINDILPMKFIVLGTPSVNMHKIVFVMMPCGHIQGVLIIVVVRNLTHWCLYKSKTKCEQSVMGYCTKALEMYCVILL